ncbi:MAG: SdrD B-like domain-containing protein [Mobiluncus porci]|uniref:SdrD B-like domain-containing protein n=1 Tax=Mobiluncus porci TaxID=2652278 RepID=UPI0023F08C13|nr:SdrD B-like domain-containing protein [Mobiluncus porci]MDD7541521.1 SdrD B-like domain-containing protein [Mobiluncus porci]MDY5748506.1 SdrD B-like domain-containing protein [Mobiluncus porci]
MAFSKMSRPKRYLSLTIGAVFTVFSLLLTSTAVANILPSGGETWVYIFYNSDDTSQNPLATFHVPSGDKLPDPGLPKTYPTGKYFDKWVECGSSTEIVPGSNTASGSGVKKACPVFTETLVITYISEGSVYETAKVTDFSSYQPPFNPVLKIIPDRQFMYWSVDNPDTTPNPARFDFSTLGSGGTNGHLRLFAIPEDRYTLIFDTTPPNSSDRCPTIKPMYIRGDRTLDQEGIRNKTNNPPTCPGYTFLHWVDPNNGSTQVTASTQTAASIDQNGDKKIILKATWQPQEVTYYIRVFTQKPGSANDTVGTTPIDDYEFRDTWKMLGQAGTIFNAADDVKFAKNIDVSVTAPDENAIGQFDAKVTYEGFKFCNTPADAAADDQDLPENTKCKSSTVNRNIASTGKINADGKSVFDIYLDRKVYKAQVYNRQYSNSPWSPLNSGNEYKLLRYGQPSDAYFAYLNTTYPGYRYYRDTSLNSYYTSPFVMPNNDVRMYRVWGNNATFQLRFYEWDASKWDADNPSAINTMLPKVNPDPANPSIRTSASFTSGQCTYMADKTGAGSCQTGNQWVDSTDHVDIEGFTQVQHDKITYDTYTSGAQAVDVNTDSTNPRWRDYMLGGQSNPNFQSTAQCREPIGSYNWICDPGSGGVSDSTHAYIGFMFYNRNAYDVRYVSKRETVATQHYLYQENLKSGGTVNTVNKAITDGATGTSYPASPQKIGEPSVSAATLKATKCTRGTSELTGNFVLQDGDICEFSGVEEIFKGWWRDPNHNQQPQYVTDTDVTMPASNTNLYAKWEKPANSIRVYQDEVRNRGDETTAKYTNIESISDGSFVEGSASELTVRVGDKTVTAHPPANASQFLGWYWIATKKDEQGETTEEMAEYVFGSSGFKIFDSNVLDGNIHDTLDVVLYPRWKYKQLKVVYDMNGGENPPVDKASPYDYLANAKTLIVPLASTSAAKQTTSGVDDLFLGWSPNQNCATTTGCTPIEPGTLENLVPNNGSTDTMTLFAVWKAPEIQTTSLTYHRNCNIADNTSYEKTNLGIRVDIDVMQNDKDDTSGDKTTFSCQSDGQELLFKCWVQDRSATSCDSGFNKDGTQSTIMLDTADETAKNHLYALWAPAVVTHDATTYAMQGQVQLSTDKVNDSAGNDQGLSATEMFSASGGNLPLNFTGATFGLHDPTDTSDPTSTITGELIVGGVATDNTPVAEAGRYSINTSTGVVTFTPNPGFVGNPTPATIVATIDGQQYTARYQPIVKPYNTVGITTTDEQKVTQRSTDKETGDHGMTAAEAFPGVELSGASYWLVDPADSTHKQNVTISGKGTYSVDSSGVVTFTPVDTFTGTSEAITLGVTTTASVDFTTTYTPTVTPVTTVNATTIGVQGDAQHSNDKNSGDNGKTPSEMFVGTDLSNAIFWLETDGTRTKTVPGEGTYTVDPATGVVTFEPEPDFTGSARGVTVGVTTRKHTEWKATYIPTVNPTTPATVPATTVGNQGETQHSNDKGSGDNGKTPEEMFPGADLDSDPDAVTYWIDNPGTTEKTVPNVGTFEVDPSTGVVTFIPEDDYIGSTTPVTVGVSDSNGNPFTSTYQPTVNPVAPPPGPPSPGGGSGTPNIPSWTVPTPNPNVSPTPTPTPTPSPTPNGEPAPGDSVDPSVPSVPGSTPKRPIDGDHGAVGELAWHDMNGDGNRDPGEPLLPGVIVQLIDENNRVVSETITGNNGEYIFNAVNPGKYYVLFKAPPGFNFTKYGYDSKADNLGRTEWFEVMRGQYYNLANAGLMNLGLAKTGFNATRFGWLALTFGGLGMLLLAAASRRRESESILIK